jgi:pilus assembly protein Flp/PilA
MSKSQVIRRFVNDQRGANLVEYIILVGLIALIAIVGFRLFGQTVRGKIDQQTETVMGINASGN